MSAPAYDSYKDSGVEWLGQVPSHWSVEPLKANTYLKARVGWKGLTSDEFKDSSYAYLVTGKDFDKSNIDWSQCYQVDKDRYEDDPFIQLRNNDLLITKDGTIGKLAFVRGLDKPACLNSGIFLVRPQKSYNNNYLYWVLSSHSFKKFIDLKSYGSTINHLYQNVFQDFSFPIPTAPEQTAIAAFLDREIGKIDALIEAQTRLIELLKEKRQAVISHAVTKGLNPDAPMKDSGIEWLGQVPAHWEVPALGYRYDVALGKMLDAKRITGDHSGPYLRNQDVQWGKINTRDLPFMDFAPDENERYSLQRGDLLVCEGGEVGRAAIWDAPLDKCYYQKALHRLRPHDPSTDHTPYLYYAINAAVNLGILTASGGKATIAHLPAEVFRRYRFAFPDLQEQISIADYLNKIATEFDTLSTEAHMAIDLLKERRAALISAAVTGKIDVRGLVNIESEAA